MAIKLGKFRITTVLDGDTITVSAPPMPSVTNRASLRLVNIDTEETHNPKSDGPVTEFGKEVAKLAISWFKERGNEVSLDTDGPKRIADYFGRPIVETFCGDEHYQKYAIESGWTPYYTKYGYSEDYHAIFTEAQQKAKKNKVGIWSDALRQRPTDKSRDYDNLLKWWNIRAEQVEKARKFKSQNPTFLMLLNGIDYQNIYSKARKQEEALIFGEIERAPGGIDAGSGLFVIKVGLDLPFYVYIDKKTNDRTKIIESIEKNFISDRSFLPDSMMKPNFAFLRGKLSLFTRFGRSIPEIVITNLKQIGKDPILP